MSHALREPVLHATPILALRPTQITVGMHEVAAKRKAWSGFDAKKLSSFLAAHMVPVILGPGKEPYLIDHHHLALALFQEGLKSVFVTVVADLHRLAKSDFWTVMDFHGWTHPYDGKGARHPYSALPKNVKGLEDDPYRALAGALRGIGGFAKDSTPFAEFLWADFLRRRIKPKAIARDYSAALAQARLLARSDEAGYLPGWCSSDTHAKQKTPAKSAAKGGSGSKT